MLDKRKFYIDGKWVDPIRPNDLEVINPATEKPVAWISLGTAADIDRAVAAAKKAFSSYSQTSADERIALLEKLLSIYKRRYDEMARTITLEVSDEELAKRRAAWVNPVKPLNGGYGGLYVKTVMQADTGADLDFLVGSRGADIPMDRDSH